MKDFSNRIFNRSSGGEKLVHSFEEEKMQLIICCIRFRSIRFVLTCGVFLFLFAMKIKYENYKEIKPIIIKRDVKLYEKTENISCYYNDDGGVFPSIDDPMFSVKNTSIFFIESACEEKITMMKACVIESAAIAHPESKIYVLFSSSNMNSLIKGHIEQVLSYSNVYVGRIHITRYAKGTVLESILANDVKKSRHPIEDVTNILKIVTLHKWGGTVLESDMMVLRPFEDLPKNWVARRNRGVSSGVLSFAKDDVGRNITSEIMKEFAKTYDPKSRLINRYILFKATIIRALKKFCPHVFTSKSGECNGLKVLSEDLFYPITVPSPLPDDENSTEKVEIEMPFTYHIRNMDFSSYPSEEWPTEDLARIFCPRVFEFVLNLK